MDKAYRILELERDFKWHLDISPFLSNFDSNDSFYLLLWSDHFPFCWKASNVLILVVFHHPAPLNLRKQAHLPLQPLLLRALGWACPLVAAPGIGLTFGFSVKSRPPSGASLFFALMLVRARPSTSFSWVFSLTSPPASISHAVLTLRKHLSLSFPLVWQEELKKRQQQQKATAHPSLKGLSVQEVSFRNFRQLTILMLKLLFLRTSVQCIFEMTHIAAIFFFSHPMYTFVLWWVTLPFIFLCFWSFLKKCAVNINGKYNRCYLERERGKNKLNGK